MRDFAAPVTARPYFSEGTAALAALVATHPARDVLVRVKHELAFRDRPAARRLAETVSAMLGSVALASAPVAPADLEWQEVTIAPRPAPSPVRNVRRKESRLAYDGDAVPAMVPDARAPEPDAPIPGWSPAPRAKVTRAKGRPMAGEAGFKPRTLEALCRAASLPTHSFGTAWEGIGNPLSLLREAGLLVTGWRPAGQYGEGYVLMTRGDARAVFCPLTGAIYTAVYGDDWQTWSAERRDVVTRAGRDAMAQAEAGKESFASVLSRLHDQAKACAAPVAADPAPVSDADALALIIGATDPTIGACAPVAGGYTDESTGLWVAPRRSLEEAFAAPMPHAAATGRVRMPRAPRKAPAPARKPRPVAF